MLNTLVIAVIAGVMAVVTAQAQTQPASAGAEVTLKGSMFCNGAAIPNPKPEDHVMILYAIDGPDQLKAEVDKIMAGYPDKGLDADAAVALMDQFTAKLKYFIAPDSPALQDAKYQQKSHYCQPVAASAITGVISEKDGKKWITASKIEPARLKYPEKMLSPDTPFAKSDKPPIVLKIDDKLSLTCVPIPAGKFLMGTPFYMWPNFQEEYPHIVTLTKPFYMAEIPVTQEMYEAVMGTNPSTEKDPQLPVQNPKFADAEKFCQLLSEKTGKKVRLPTDAEWEYVARVGTSSPGFQEKYKEQNSSGPNGFKTVLKVKSKQPNAWGLYDMASSWWEITGDKGMYNVRHAETDPKYPPPAGDNPRTQRSGRGILKEGWSAGTHEFITENADYAGQKFRVAVEDDSAAPASAPAGQAR